MMGLGLCVLCPGLEKFDGEESGYAQRVADLENQITDLQREKARTEARLLVKTADDALEAADNDVNRRKIGFGFAFNCFP